MLFRLGLKVPQPSDGAECAALQGAEERAKAGAAEQARQAGLMIPETEDVETSSWTQAVAVTLPMECTQRKRHCLEHPHQGHRLRLT